MTWKSESALKRKNNFSTHCGYWTETNKPEKKEEWGGKSESKDKTKPQLISNLILCSRSAWQASQSRRLCGTGVPSSATKLLSQPGALRCSLCREGVPQAGQAACASCRSLS